MLFLKQTVLSQLDIHMRKRNVDHYLTSYIKINSRWITDPNMKGETVKLLKQNMGAYFYKLGFKKQRFLKQDQKKKKTLITKEKKLVSWSTLKDSFNLSSKTPKEKLISTQWEKTCATHLFSKGLICKVYKEFSQIIEKNRQQTEKWAKHLNRPSQKKGMSRWPIHL